MAITGVNPITVPAVPAVVYPSRWIKHFILDAPGLTAGTALFKAVGYKADTNAIQPGAANEFVEVKDVWKAITKVPEAATFMNALFALYPAIKAYVDAGEPDVWPPVEEPIP